MNIHKSFTIAMIVALVIAGAGLVAAHGIRSVFPAEYTMHGNEGGEGNGEHGSGGEGGPGPGEETGATYALDETFDTVRNGVRLVMSWDATAEAFIGVVENVTDATIPAVRVEVHLSNGVELGPTPRAVPKARVNMAAAAKVAKAARDPARKRARPTRWTRPSTRCATACVW